MRTLIFTAGLFLCAAPLALAQGPKFRDGEIWPVAQADGVRHYSECRSYSSTCTLWVRLPRRLVTADLIYSSRGNEQLRVPVAIVDLSQEEVDALFVPGPVHRFLSGGFWGFRLDISRRFARRASVWLSGDNETLIYELKHVDEWLADDK